MSLKAKISVMNLTLRQFSFAIGQTDAAQIMMLNKEGWKQLEIPLGVSCKACGGGVPVSLYCTGVTTAMCV